MTPYGNSNGDSGVVAYELGGDFICVQFRNAQSYRYSHATAGQIHVTRMKALAVKGRGLSTYIAQHVHHLHDR